MTGGGPAGPRLGGARLWPVVCLRSAGLPIESLAPLATDELAAAVDAGADRGALDRLLADYWARLPAALSAAPAADLMLAALTWQNPAAAETTARPVLAGRYRPGTSTQRYKLASVVTYLQRYAARNDTIGFFGPAAWGAITKAPGRLTQSDDEPLIAELRVFLEDWAVQEIAVALTRGRPTAYRPAVGPHCRVEHGGLLLPMGGRVTLTEVQARVLDRCSGTATASEIATATGLPGAAVEEVLVEFERRGLVSPVPLVDPPDAAAGGAVPLAGLSAVPRAGRVLAAVDAAARALVPVARDPAGLPPALDRLHALFAGVTGRREHRAAEQVRTARTVARVEARRGGGFSLGRDTLRDLDAPMQVLLHVSRWLVRAAVDRTEQLLRDDVLRAGGVLRLCDLWLSHADLWYAPRPAHLAPLIAQAQARWVACLGEAATAARPVVLDPAALLGTVQRAFPAPPGPPPPVEAYACPDILLDVSATSAGGVPTYVLGELHLGRNTLGTALFSDCSDNGSLLDKLWRADGGQPAAVSASYLAAGRRMRSRFARYADVELAVSAQSPGLSRGAWRLADVDVLAGGGSLIARHRRDRRELPLLALLSDPIAVSLANLFRPFPPAGHQPRVSLGPLVVAREAWMPSPPEVTELRSATGVDRLIGMRRLARRHGMPRYLFSTTAPGEKPLFVDVSSPASVDVFVRRLRRVTGRCTLTEMLPPPAGLWLRDSDGRCYTSELRLALALFSGDRPRR